MSKQLEFRILPSLHLVDQLLVDLALSKKQVKNFPLPDAQQSVRVHRRKADKRTVGSISPISRNHVNVGMEVDQLAKCLNAGNRAGENVVAFEYRPIHFYDRVPRCAGEPA